MSKLECVYCNKAIGDGTAVVSKGKIYHEMCKIDMENKQTKQKHNAYPDIDSDILDGLELEGCLNQLQHTYCVICMTKECECNAKGFVTVEEVKEYILECLEEKSEWDVELVCKNGKPVKWNVKHTVEIDDSFEQANRRELNSMAGEQ